MDKFTRIGIGCNRAEFRVAERIGKQVGFSHRGKPEETIWVQVLDQEIGNDTSIKTRQKEEFILKVLIPSQKNNKGEWIIYSTQNTETAPDAKCITTGDKLEWPLNSGRFYIIPNNEAIKTYHNGFTYLVVFEACRILTSGQRS